MEENITTIKVDKRDRDYLLRLKKSKGFDSARTTINRMIKLIKLHRMEDEI